jgi:hypothetical protein
LSKRASAFLFVGAVGALFVRIHIYVPREGLEELLVGFLLVNLEELFAIRRTVIFF